MSAAPGRGRPIAPVPPVPGNPPPGDRLTSDFWLRVQGAAAGSAGMARSAGSAGMARSAESAGVAGITGITGTGDPETGADLTAATRAAWRRDDLAVAFRRNRELLDVHGTFRRFSVSGAPHVAKVTTSVHADRERSRAAAVADLLAGAHDRFFVPVPHVVELDEGLAALVLPDFGHTLAETALRPDARLSGFDVLGTAAALLRHGVLWGGYAPRNICPTADGRLVLLDMEDATPAGAAPSVSELTLQFWTVNWTLPGQDPVRLRDDLRTVLADAGVPVRRHPPDAYERAVADLCQVPGERAQEMCARATREAWRPLATDVTHPGSTLAPGDVCHLLDELLPLRGAVSTLLTLAALRRRESETAYAERLHAGESLLVEELVAAGTDRAIRPDPTVLDGLPPRLLAADWLA